MAPDGLADITTLTGNNGLTIMVMVLEVAGFPEGQTTLELRTQVIPSLFTSVASE